MKKHDIFAIGELNVDIVMNVPDISDLVLGTEIFCDRSTLALGSSTAIFACVASSLGKKVAFEGRLAPDSYGDFCRKTLKRYNVDDTYVYDITGETGITVSLSTPQDRVLLTYCGDTIDAMSAGDIHEGIFEDCRHIHVSSYFMNAKLAKGLPGFFKTAREKGVTTSLDTGWDPSEKWDSVLDETLKYTDIFFPNKKEVCAIGGSDDIYAAAECIKGKMPASGILAIKCGETGSLVFSAGGVIQQGIFETQVLDTTGAGDSFDAGFLAAWLSGETLAKCAEYASAAAAVSVTRLSGTLQCPTPQEVAQLMANNC